MPPEFSAVYITWYIMSAPVFGSRNGQVPLHRRCCIPITMLSRPDEVKYIISKRLCVILDVGSNLVDEAGLRCGEASLFAPPLDRNDTTAPANISVPKLRCPGLQIRKSSQVSRPSSRGGCCEARGKVRSKYKHQSPFSRTYCRCRSPRGYTVIMISLARSTYQ